MSENSTMIAARDQVAELLRVEPGRTERERLWRRKGQPLHAPAACDSVSSMK
jgi:hypothetical protein